jgi:hypothetical protein
MREPISLYTEFCGEDAEEILTANVKNNSAIAKSKESVSKRPDADGEQGQCNTSHTEVRSS